MWTEKERSTCNKCLDAINCQADNYNQRFKVEESVNWQILILALSIARLSVKVYSQCWESIHRIPSRSTGVLDKYANFALIPTL